MNNWINWYKIHAEDKNSKIFSGTSPLIFTGDGNPLQTISITGGIGGAGIRTHNLFDSTKIKSYNGGIASLNYVIYDDFISAQEIANWEGDYKITVEGILNRRLRETGIEVTANAYDSSFNPIISTSISRYKDNYIPGLPSMIEYHMADIIPFDRFQNLQNIENINAEDIAYYKIVIGYSKEIKEDTLKIQMLKVEKDDPIDDNSIDYDYEPYGYKIPLLCNSELRTLYLDSLIEEGETKIFSNLEIPTVKGENTFIIDGNAGPATISVQTQGMSEGFENYFRTQLCLRH